MLKIMFYFIIVIFLNACKYPNHTAKELKESFLDINNTFDDFLIKKIDDYSKIKIKVNKSNKEKYILFTNVSNENSYISLNIKGDTKQIESNINKQYINRKNIFFKTIPEYIINLNHKIPDNLKKIKLESNETNLKKISFDKISDKRIFYLKEDLSKKVKATARKIIKNIDTKYGKKTLNIWVSDDSFGDCDKAFCVKEYMLDELANSFLKKGEDNDIYDWVTNILGKEWGKVDDSLFIKNNNEINILLTDIDNDNEFIGGIAGYFYSKDNYRKEIYKGSNERIMFYIDSVLFASYFGEDKWSIDNYQTKRILSTLAHEFTHMIGFYQKNIIQRSSLTPWIDEMLALSVEDIIATKLKTDGVRAVSYVRGDAGDDYNQNGKFPIFNKNMNQTLPKWDNTLENYAVVSSFGSYLLRNYGGASLLHDILYNKFSNQKAIEYAINKNGFNKDFDTLIQDWGIAVLLSSSTNLDVDSGYLYNLGDFLETSYNNINYSLGSIDFFKYYDKPNILSKVTKIEPNSNLYYKIPESLDESIIVELEKSKDIRVALVFK